MSLDTDSLERLGTRPRARHAADNRAPRPSARLARSTGEQSAGFAVSGERAPSAAAIRSALGHALASPSALRRAYLRMLAPAHNLVRDRHVEKLLFKPTPGPSGTANARRPGGELIPGKVLDWIIGDLDVTLRECAFMDFRAGNGRTLLYAAMHDFERVIGYEYSEEAHSDAQINIGQFPRTLMKCRDVECRRGDQGDMAIPRQPLVLFFPNTAHERLLSLILDHVAASYRLEPRTMFLILQDAPEAATFDHDDIFYKFELSMATRLKLRLFSPVNVRVYRSIV